MTDKATSHAPHHLQPDSFVLTRKRKKYKFALFYNSPLCFEIEEWHNQPEPRVLEIGAGTGLFSVALAGASPHLHYLAVDVKADRLQVGARLAEEKQLANLQFLRTHGQQLPELVTPSSLTNIWITFPDPFPKRRAAKHRLTHSRFLAIYQTLLQKDGALYLKTDAPLLFSWSLEQLVAHGWVIRELSFDLHDSLLLEEYKVKTTYETRFVDEGLPIHFVRASPPSTT